MQKFGLSALFVVFFIGACFSQSLNDPLSQGTTSQGTADCSDPSNAGSAQCVAAQAQRSGSIQGEGSSSSPMRTPVLTTPGGLNDQYVPSKPPLNPSEMGHLQTPTRPETEFEQMVADSVGRALPLFGQSLFVQPPSTFTSLGPATNSRLKFGVRCRLACGQLWTVLAKFISHRLDKYPWPVCTTEIWSNI
jgi:hypothetical protein